MKKTFIFLTFLLFALNASGQDSHYWSTENNPAGFLTPGAAVAFTRDSGVFYNNPALLAYNDKSSASISGSLYQFEQIKINNGIGKGLNLNSTNASIIPIMASGLVAIKGSKKFTVGYAIINTPILSYQASQQKDAKLNVLQDYYSPGDESFLGQFNTQNTINETSALISGGFKVSEAFSLGLSAEGQYHKQRFEIDDSQRVFINTPTTSALPPFSNVQESYLANYYNIGIKFKAGISYNVAASHFGLTVSSPLLHIKGSGNILSDNVISDLKTGPTDTINLLASSRQTKLKEQWKMPISIAGGYAYDYGKGQIYVSAEYFSSISEYNVITPTNSYFIRPNAANNQFTSDLLKLKDARKAITNFGIGVSYLLKPNVMGYLSARTNFSYAGKSLFSEEDAGYPVYTTYYNNIHWQLGANFKKRKFNFRTGLLFGYGFTNKYEQYINYDTPHENNFLTGEPRATSQSHLSVGLMFAYIHNL